MTDEAYKKTKKHMIKVSGTVFLLTGCLLLVLKLTSVAEFSWFWVFGVMFFPTWLFISIILAILGCCLFAVALIVVIAIIIGLVYFPYQAINKLLLKKKLLSMKERYNQIHGR